MASDLQVNVSSALNWCVTNHTESQCLTAENGRNVNTTTTSNERSYWFDSAYKITWVSLSVVVDSVSCFAGIVCTSLALAVLCQRKNRQCSVSSALFLQRTMVVMDLCFLVICVPSRIVEKGYDNDVFQYASSIDEYNHQFANGIFSGPGNCITMVSVWLIAVITVDR